MVSCSQEVVSVVGQPVPVTRAVVDVVFPTITYDAEPGTEYTWADAVEGDLVDILVNALDVYQIYFVAPGVVEFDLTDQGIEDGKVTMTIPGIDVQEWTVNMDMITYATLRFDSIFTSVDISLDIIPEFVSITTSFTVNTDESLNVPLNVSFTTSGAPVAIAEFSYELYGTGGLAQIVELAGIEEDVYVSYKIDMSSQGIEGGFFTFYLNEGFDNWTVEINDSVYEYLLLHPDDPVFAFVELIPGVFTFTFNLSATEE